MMTGQLLSVEQVAIASARTPAQSRNVTPAKSKGTNQIQRMVMARQFLKG